MHVILPLVLKDRHLSDSAFCTGLEVPDGIYIPLDLGLSSEDFHVLRFCEDNFVGEMESTIGVDFYLNEIDVDGKKIKVSLSFILPNGYHLASRLMFIYSCVYVGQDLGHGWIREVHVNICCLLSKSGRSHTSV